MKAGLEKLYEHIDDIEIAMMTTRRPDGHLQSRAMATQKRAEGADLWFVTLAIRRSCICAPERPRFNSKDTSIAPS